MMFLPKQNGGVLDGVKAQMTRAWYAWAQTVSKYLDGMPWSGSTRLLSGQVLSLGNNDLAHGLGRAATGYLITKSSAAVTTYGDVTGSNPDVTTYIRINSSGVATVDVVVW